jgi:hypothetical protein
MMSRPIIVEKLMHKKSGMHLFVNNWFIIMFAVDKIKFVELLFFSYQY